MHWIDLRTNKDFVPDTLDRFGFVYVITNIKRDKYFIFKNKKLSPYK